MNEVEITVTSKDRTSFGAIGSNIKATISGTMQIAGDDAGKNFKRGFASSFSRGSNVFFGHLAENATGIFSRAFGTAISSNPIIGKAVAGAVGIAALAVLPSIGAAAAGALVGGFGAGLVGLGIAFAAQNEGIRHEFSHTTDHIKARMTEISQPFEGTLLRINGIFRRTFDFFEPYIKTTFERLSGPVGDFVDMFGRSLEKLAPTIGPITDAFEALLDELGPELPGIMEGIANGITRVAESVKNNPEGFVNLVKFIGDATEKGLRFIAFLNDLEETLRLLNETGPGSDAGAQGEGFLGFLNDVESFLNRVAEAAANSGKATRGFLEDVGGFLSTDWITPLGDMLEAGWGMAIDWVRGKISDFINWLQGTWVGRLFNAVFGAETGPVHRSKGESEGLGGNWASRLFRSLFGADTGGVGFGLRAALGMGGRWASSFWRSLFSGDSGPARSALNAALAAGRSWAGRVFTATFNVFRKILPGFAHGGVIGAASGGARGNMVMVGEHGRELVRLPYGSTVIPNGQTESMMKGGGGGRGGMVLDIRSGGSRLDELLVELIRKSVRTQGGDVQVVLGS